MLRLIIKQFGLGLIVVLAAITLTFVMVRASGDPTSLILPQDAPAEQRTLLRSQLGLDRPVLVQYFSYVAGAVRGDFGRSYFDGDSVTAIILRPLPNTLLLAGTALLIAIILGIPLGVMSAVWQGGVLDRTVQVASVFTTSMPSFWLGLLLIQVFAVWLGWVPTYGSGTAAHLILPAVTVACWVFPSLTRLTRSSMLEVLPAGYIASARAKGMPEYRVISRTLLRNGIVPVLALLALEVGSLLGGAVLTEAVFSWPGIGRLAIQSIQRRDFPVVQGIVAYVAMMFVVITVLSEIAVRIVNPRLRHT
ncbi:ABC transporter permease [Variovorax fucosicus]|uniref:ABC transporter permease n=1 Tax=Variovorax fucosicus TaxID=3053517 RepID=UPI0025783497|nr:ABC transporter permease [Variovorax sp. J22G47]MDM0058477.1 ABC transporter permease [Variovorax sp. J22G47]